jgi:hypothetical protein
MAEPLRKPKHLMLSRTWSAVLTLRGLDVPQIEASIANAPGLSDDQKEAFRTRVGTLVKIAAAVYDGATFALACKPLKISSGTLFRWFQAFQKKGLLGLIPVYKNCGPKNLAGREKPTAEQMRANARAAYAAMLALRKSNGISTVPKPGQ